MDGGGTWAVTHVGLAYHLFKVSSAHGRNDAQRMDVVVLRVELGVVWVVGAIVAQHHVRMDFGVQVLDTTKLLELVLERGLSLRVSGLATASIARIGQVAIAVDVHIGERGRAVQEYGLALNTLLAVGPL